MESYTKFIGMVSSVVTIFVGLLGIIIKSHLKRIEEKFNNEKEQRKAADEELETIFKEGAKTERRFYQEVFKRHDELIKELFDNKVSKELCNERHKWNGVDRREK